MKPGLSLPPSIARMGRFREGGIFVALIVICAMLTIATPKFLTSYNIGIVIRQVSFVAIVAMGQTMVLLTGGIDLAVGSIAGLCGIMGAIVMAKAPVDPYIACLLAMGLGLLIGAISGFFIAYVKMNAFIVTLGMGEICAGTNLVITRGYPVLGIPAQFNFLGQGMIGPIPIPVVIMLLLMLLFTYLLTSTPYGRNIYAIGGNQNAARLVGIQVARVQMSVYAMSGLLAAFAGMIFVSRVNAGQPTVGPSWLMPSITAAIISGTTLSGGEGTIIGAIIGAVFMGVLSNGIVLMDISSYWERVIIGSVVIIAVLLDVLRKRER
jgi:ribose transport system permease protein